ncbi:aldehyde dehydrogenase family protein [Cocleimonas flava]|uniref:Sulfoacetaldehyde dehydrogenase n=1 Tax=Cocleimonas flava TaxID=634765 RepID=A0A4R1F096_9GAMM|nr:aldehyde dehydrogenase family protein [Cocleimonas flava]TCJ87183.1 sulfoacetaldehyde dehydrogenase [Cocleimonas flava]
MDTERQHSTSNNVTELVNRARKAQLIYEQYTQEQVDEVVTALGWSIMNPENNKTLAMMSVADTGLGNVEDKIIKNHRKTLGLLRDLQGVKTVGVVSENIEKGIVKIARPVGAVGAIVPSTNPAATPANKTINALKCRNAMILAPSPKGASSCAKLVEFMHAELERIGAPKDLVQHLPFPINKADTQQLMKEVDLVVATGSQNNMRDAYASGTPAFGVGAGNVVSIVDETADLDSAAQKIVASKAFDNATSCSSENQLVIVDAVYDQMIEALAKQHAIMLSDSERDKVCEKLWQNGYLNQAVIAKKANEIAQMCELDSPNQENAKVLCVAATGIGKDHPLSGEKLSPVLTVYRASDFNDAKNITNHILDFQGKGHSISIHSNNDERILDLGLNMPACRIIVNQAHCFATGGSFDNGMPFSLSMGCGTWGNNNMSDNMNYKYYLNTTRIVRTIPVNQPSLDSVFGDYWKAHNISPLAAK